ncbi:hypothetical protein HK097_011679 [Rhizophlyctis rosea]|uniref:Uncharacterized protein n=1 Tax=Rhizophlyctis rosea TaxID=64517 RepID=A0AAD5X1Q6_9FUNG|nr:hypothetical protein HK097_011679 [Rhizophlyctis rosea]
MQGAGQGGRSYRTLIPVSEALNIPITALDKVHMTAQEVAEHIKGLGSRKVLICWEHTGLHDVAVALGLTEEDAPQYKGTDYDTVWEITGGNLKKWDQGCTQPGSNEGGLDFGASGSGALGVMGRGREVVMGWWVVAVGTVILSVLFGGP